MRKCVMEVKQVDEMKRLQISLRSDILEKLDVLAREMGLKRSSVLALLINEKWKEEHTD